jgi:hypothetical protein
MSSSGRHHLIEMLKGKELVIIAVLSVIAISLFVLFYTLDVSAVKSNLAPVNTKSSNDNQKTIMRSLAERMHIRSALIKDPIPPDCTKNPFPNSTMALR